ncbi:hypothetical protein V1478_016621 [Vespula squamosa]|uniref:Uncharacterized protein n=1 Tax=Vespula squamosa TaxID=30214 RepID=A0ABD2A0B5_VESSQ
MSSGAVQLGSRCLPKTECKVAILREIHIFHQGGRRPSRGAIYEIRKSYGHPWTQWTPLLSQVESTKQTLYITPSFENVCASLLCEKRMRASKISCSLARELKSKYIFARAMSGVSQKKKRKTFVAKKSKRLPFGNIAALRITDIGIAYQVPGQRRERSIIAVRTVNHEGDTDPCFDDDLSEHLQGYRTDSTREVICGDGGTVNRKCIQSIKPGWNEEEERDVAAKIFILDRGSLQGEFIVRGAEDHRELRILWYTRRKSQLRKDSANSTRNDFL